MKIVYPHIRIIALVLLLLAGGFPGQAQKKDLKQYSIEDYIKIYSPLAVSEMRRTGIPASITLAQGILESNFGNSVLAQKANNHFGIKCHSGWSGKKVYMDDDKARECFRKYPTVKESFIDHSNFLVTRPRYAFLFDYKPTDYKNWARGLQKAGYATNQNYAKLLIRIIEERKLDKYDTAKPGMKYDTEKEVLEKLDNKIFVFNNIKVVIVQPNQTALDIAQKYQMRLKQILKYNDLEEDRKLQAGTKIYLQPKKRKGFNKVHEVEEGETMWFIAQKEGIKLRKLYKKNHMEPGEEPKEGAILCLKRRCKEKPPLKTDEEIKQQIEEKLEEKIAKKKAEEKKKLTGKVDPSDEGTLTPTETVPDVQKTSSSTDTTKGAQATNTTKKNLPNPTHKVVYHEVEKGETLTKLSMEYYVTLEKLRYWNNLDDNATIKPGQKMVVGAPDGYQPPKPKATTPKAETKTAGKEQPAEKETKEAVQYHTVEHGETLYAISRKYNLSVAELKKLNKLQSNVLSTGQKLIVGKKLLKNPKETADNTPKEAIVEEKNDQQPDNRALFKGNTSTETAKTHTVQPGETLYSIATEYNVEVDELMELNNLQNSNLSVGQKLKVSGGTITLTPDQQQEEEKEEPKGMPVYHVVEKGQGLWSISKQYGVTIETLREWNNLPDNNIIAGQKLIVGYDK